MSEHFPDCTIYHMEQRSDEWKTARKGVLTASNFGPWLLDEKKVQLTIEEIKTELDKLGLTYPKSGKKEDYIAILPNAESYMQYGKGTASARENAICTLIAERAGCAFPPDNGSWATRRGEELEPEALKAFTAATGIELEEVGFCRSIHGSFGCSPDGLVVGESAGFEGKVLVPQNHLAGRRAGIVPSEYIHQVHGCMAVTGAQSWWFQLWNPNLAPLRIVIERDDFTEKLKAALIAFSTEYEQAWLDEVAANTKGVA
jgi:hypothetical protein